MARYRLFLTSLPTDRRRLERYVSEAPAGLCARALREALEGSANLPLSVGESDRDQAIEGLYEGLRAAGCEVYIYDRGTGLGSALEALRDLYLALVAPIVPVSQHDTKSDSARSEGGEALRDGPDPLKVKLLAASTLVFFLGLGGLLVLQAVEGVEEATEALDRTLDDRGDEGPARRGGASRLEHLTRTLPSGGGRTGEPEGDPEGGRGRARTSPAGDGGADLGTVLPALDDRDPGPAPARHPRRARAPWRSHAWSALVFLLGAVCASLTVLGFGGRGRLADPRAARWLRVLPLGTGVGAAAAAWLSLREPPPVPEEFEAPALEADSSAPASTAPVPAEAPRGPFQRLLAGYRVEPSGEPRPAPTFASLLTDLRARGGGPGTAPEGASVADGPEEGGRAPTAARGGPRVATRPGARGPTERGAHRRGRGRASRALARRDAPPARTREPGATAGGLAARARDAGVGALPRGTTPAGNVPHGATGPHMADRGARRAEPGASEGLDSNGLNERHTAPVVPGVGVSAPAPARREVGSGFWFLCGATAGAGLTLVSGGRRRREGGAG